MPRIKHLQDAEALRRAPGGGWWVTFEGRHRIAWYSDGREGLAAPPQYVMQIPERFQLFPNHGLESVAVLPDGSGLAIAERSGRALALHFNPFRDSIVEKHFYSAFSPVDMVGLANGGLLVLTRSPIWPLPPRFATELVYVEPGWEGQNEISGRSLFRLDTVLPAENYEGMAVEESDGRTVRIWLISDDNFFSLQDTILAELEMPVACFSTSVRCRLKAIKAPLPPSPTE